MFPKNIDGSYSSAMISKTNHKLKNQSVWIPVSLSNDISRWNVEHPEHTIVISRVCRKSLEKALSDNRKLLRDGLII